MAISWVDFSLNLKKGDFVFLAGETCHDRLLRALAGFLPEESNAADSIRIDGQRIKLSSILLPKDATASFPPHRPVGAFAIDLVPGATKKRIESHATGYGIDKRILHCKPKKISPVNLQKISLWLCSLNPSSAIFIEEPDGGFFDECRPFDFLQGLLTTKGGITDCIVFLADKKESIMQKAKALQLCRARIAVFCADRLVEEGEAMRILENPIHFYTKEWLRMGTLKPKKQGTLWQYCLPDCKEQYNCAVRQNTSSVMWDCEQQKLHKIACRGFGGT